MPRTVFYTMFIGFLFFILPLPGDIQKSNIVTDTMFLRDGVLGVTFPWGGIIIKSNLDSDLYNKVLAHEMCHVKQAKEYGATFYLEYINNVNKFESECYKVSNDLKIKEDKV